MGVNLFIVAGSCITTMKRDRPGGKGPSETRGRRGRGRSRPVVDGTDIPEGRRRVLASFPVRNFSPDLRWYKKKKDGLVVIKIRKRLSRFETRLRRMVGGPEFLRVPLDGPGSMIWDLCDGEHDIEDIAKRVHDDFKEEVEPVLPRVIKFVELLLRRNLIVLVKAEDRDRVLIEMRKEARRLKEDSARKKGEGGGGLKVIEADD